MVPNWSTKLQEDWRTNWDLVEVGVDWLTATYTHGRPSAAIAVLADRWQRDRSQDGFDLKPWAWNGYRGSVVDGVTWGTRDDGSILRLSGKFARQHFLAATSFATNVSRIDLQLTAYNSSWPTGLATSVNLGVAGHPAVISGQTQTTITRHTPSGETLNIGSRSSNRFFRIYDKAAESGGEYEVGTWRYEIEYKADRAYRLAKRLERGITNDQEILELLSAAFAEYNVITPIVSKPMGWKERDIARTTDDQRRLEWLRTCIRPCVVRMHEAFSADVLAEALGLYGIIDELNGYVESWAAVDVGRTET